MRLLMIHGRGQAGENPDQLKQVWVETLKKGFEAIEKPFPDDIQIDFPFYGDELGKFVNRAESENIRVQGDGLSTEFEAFVTSALVQIKNNAQISDEAVKNALGVNVNEQAIQNWGWVQAIARVIDNRFTGTADFTIEKFLRDVYLYVNIPEVTEEINKIIEASLFPKKSNTPPVEPEKESIVIIGHSLGSVVGYKVILKNLDKFNLIRYITVGSPLGLRAISGRLGILKNPGKTKNDWYNAYDVNDIVALHPLDRQYFPTRPDVYNYGGVDNKTPNQHGIIGYLNDKDVAQKIYDAINAPNEA